MQLVAADALLARTHQKGALKPDVQWDVARLDTVFLRTVNCPRLIGRFGDTPAGTELASS
jgi:hypothetical protein